MDPWGGDASYRFRWGWFRVAACGYGLLHSYVPHAYAVPVGHSVLHGISKSELKSLDRGF